MAWWGKLRWWRSPRYSGFSVDPEKVHMLMFDLRSLWELDAREDYFPKQDLRYSWDPRTRCFRVYLTPLQITRLKARGFWENKFGRYGKDRNYPASSA